MSLAANVVEFCTSTADNVVELFKSYAANVVEHFMRKLNGRWHAKNRLQNR